MSWMHDLLAGLGVGLAGGLTSGLLGVSPGGGLVIFSVLLLGAEQHVAQGTSLIAQVPPMGLAGVRRYWRSGNRSPLDWIIWIGIGFLVGGVAGGYAALAVSDSFLQWAYVAYLTALIAALILRRERKDEHERTGERQELHWGPQLLVGMAAGFSSGFMGIGGGLAITVGLTAGLRVPQHQAQLVSLVFSVIPTTVLPASIYWSKGAPGELACDHRHPRRSLARHRSWRAHGQWRQQIGASPDHDRVRVRDGPLYGLQGADLTRPLMAALECSIRAVLPVARARAPARRRPP